YGARARASRSHPHRYYVQERPRPKQVGLSNRPALERTRRHGHPRAGATRAARLPQHESWFSQGAVRMKKKKAPIFVEELLGATPRPTPPPAPPPAEPASAYGFASRTFREPLWLRVWH